MLAVSKEAVFQLSSRRDRSSRFEEVPYSNSCNQHSHKFAYQKSQPHPARVLFLRFYAARQVRKICPRNNAWAVEWLRPPPTKNKSPFEILSWAGNNGNHNLEWRCTQAYYHGEIKRIPIFQRHLEARDWPKVSAFLPGDKEVVILIVLRRVAVKLFDCASLAAPFEVLLY